MTVINTNAFGVPMTSSRSKGFFWARGDESRGSVERVDEGSRVEGASRVKCR